MRRSMRNIVAGLLVVGGLAAAPAPNLSGYPNSMAAVGDSITRAYNSGTVSFTDQPGKSWATGTRSSVRSHYLRILDAQPAISDRNFNEAVSGANVSDPDTQVAVVNARAVAY